MSVPASTSMSAHHMHAYCLERPEEGARSPETGATGSRELSCGSWKLSPGPLQKQQVFSSAKPLSHAVYFTPITHIYMWILLVTQETSIPHKLHTPPLQNLPRRSWHWQQNPPLKLHHESPTSFNHKVLCNRSAHVLS